jgi:hypothetical protein
MFFFKLPMIRLENQEGAVMEVNFTPPKPNAKVEEPNRVKMPLRPIADAYRKVGESSDQVQVSSKGKLLLSLRESYSKLDEAKPTVGSQEIAKKLESGKALNPEEIVNGILQGTLFQSV